MKARIKIIILVFGLLYCGVLTAQTGFSFSDERKSVDIPFEYRNNFIILHFVVNGKLPLNFIFDTGAGHTILTKKELAPVLGLVYERSFQVLGSDLSRPLTAFLSRNVSFEIPGKILAPSQDILVLDEDCFQFEEYTGIMVHGVLSASAFDKYIFQINYDKGVITLFTRNAFTARDKKGFERLPIEVYRNKPYLLANLTMPEDSVAHVKLLLDTGAGMPLLLFADTHPLLQPPENALFSKIGAGLGGQLDGYTGRLKHVDIGPFALHGVVTYFQTLDSLYERERGNNRNGIVGNNLLRHYNVVLDYHGEQVWLKPSRHFNEEFDFDRSGIAIIAAGPNLNQHLVQHLIPDSPADSAGIMVGDQILKVGWRSGLFLTMSGIIDLFEGKAGTRLKVVIRRNGVKMKKTIVLRDLI